MQHTSGVTAPEIPLLVVLSLLVKVQKPAATLSGSCLQARARYGSNELPHEEGMPYALALLPCMTMKGLYWQQYILVMLQQPHAAWVEDAAACQSAFR
jgi:hypothetical protein